MALLSVKGLQVSFGAEVLFGDVSFEIGREDRVGLAGANGAGKTTLFALLRGNTDNLTSGTIERQAGLSIGFMEQHLQAADENQTLFENALSVFARQLALETELQISEQALNAGSDDIADSVIRHNDLLEAFHREDGLTFRARTASALQGLGFSPEDRQKPLTMLSGGERSKLQLAKLLLSKSDLLLLDEPTNHLDIPALEWLESLLREQKRPFVIISHDRYFLDAVTNKTLELDRGRLYYYKGNYSEFLRKKAEARMTALKEYEQQAAEVARIEAIIAQQKRFNQAHNYVTIASKQKQIDRIKAAMIKPEPPPPAFRFSLEITSGTGNDVLTSRNLSLTLGTRQLFSDVTLDIKSGERVFLLGANGSGKTSLFRILMGEYAATAGEFRYGARVIPGYYDQMQQGLSGEKTVMDEIWDAFPQMLPGEVRNALGRFLFRGDEVFKSIGKLSGGEKARVALLKLLLSGCNLLLLDEPTNHLDARGREALEGALADYPGTLFMISHDRYFINKLATRVYELSEKGIADYRGDYNEYVRLKQLQAAPDSKARDVSAEQAAAKASYLENKKSEKEQRLLSGKLRRAEELVATLERRVKYAETVLASPGITEDYEKYMDLIEEHEDLQRELDAALADWIELQS